MSDLSIDGSPPPPQISILSAVRNEEKYIEEMMQSVRAQSLSTWELLIVDDGSTDATTDLVTAFAESDPRVRLIEGRLGLGKVSAFNHAFRASRGDAVVLLAGDDRLPQGSLSMRYDTIMAMPTCEPCVAFFKMRMFSEDKRFDGLVVPRGDNSSHSGGSITMNRALAEILFPIEESLVSEDIWLGYGAAAVARHTTDDLRVVLDYRIHEHNSNPRHKPFSEMNASLHARHRAWNLLLDCTRLQLEEKDKDLLRVLSMAEDNRYNGDIVRVLLSHLPVIDRLAMVASASPALYRVRTHFYNFFSGRRGR